MKFYRYCFPLVWLLNILPYHLTQAHCPSQLEMQFKHGNHRTLTRGHILIPLWHQSKQLLFTHVAGFIDHQNQQEINMGLGYRQQHKKQILGIYGYYDRRLCAHHQSFHQVTLGLEYLKSQLEMRLNGYWPLQPKCHTSSLAALPKFMGAQYDGVKLNQQVFSYALNGLDAELGFKVAKIPVDIYGSYYYFKHQRLIRVHGPRLRVKAQLTSYLSMSTDLYYDKSRRFNYFLGVELNVALNANRHFTKKLTQKMTQLPIRDIDIIIQAGEQTFELDTQTAEIIESYADLNKIRQNLSGLYIVTKDIIQLGQKHIPIGSKEAPFRGTLVGISDDRTELQVRKIHGLIIDVYQENIGLFSYTDHACIGYLSICHQPLVFISGKKHNARSYLSYNAIGSLVGRAHDYNIFIHNTNIGSLCVVGHYNHLGGLVGYANNHNLFLHNRNLGRLSAIGTNNNLGGILGETYEYNTLSYNINLGFIKLQPINKETVNNINHLGGMVGLAVLRNSLVHNTNSGILCALDDSESHIGGIAGAITLENVCIHNTNMAELYGTKLGGIISDAQKHNMVSYNFNNGALIGLKNGSSMGGILQAAKAINVISYNANSGKISGRDPTMAGIIAIAQQHNTITYNMNIGELIGDKESIYNEIAGIAAWLSLNNKISHNINTGAILIQAKNPKSDLKGLSIIGGIVSQMSSKASNSITYNMNIGSIQIGKKSTEHYIGNIIGIGEGVPNNAFKHNIYSQALNASHSTTDINYHAHFICDEPFIKLPHLSAAPSWKFGINEDWFISTKGPILTWVLKNRSLQLLKQFNNLKIIYAHHWLSLDMLLEIVGLFDDFGYLNLETIKKIYHYAFTPSHLLVKDYSSPKYLWSKNNFLTYVIESP